MHGKTNKNEILIVDDNPINCRILEKILSEDYVTTVAANGKQAMDILLAEPEKYSCVMLDLVVPLIDGFQFLERKNAFQQFRNLPVIVTTELNEIGNEKNALRLGAWDFVSKPYEPDIIRFRLKNAIDRSQLAAFNQLKYITEYDVLTNMYNKQKLFAKIRQMLDLNSEKKYVFMRIDIDRFKLINSFFGSQEGDRLLKYIANMLTTFCENRMESLCGRIQNDVFAICMSYDSLEDIAEVTDFLEQQTVKYKTDFYIVPAIGLYLIDERFLSVENMFDRASLAAKQIKGNYLVRTAFYTPEMGLSVEAEQQIVNEIEFAIKSRQFQVFMQPKYDLKNHISCGAEALVRWFHPERGMILPGEFIPILERNGFVSRLDRYVWEQVCISLRRWIDMGIEPCPISVNVSRINLYDPNLITDIVELINRYSISPEYLNLEITESAYVESPRVLTSSISKLRKCGFSVFMDDFGSGYSSLNVLKDIEVDMLKIDMNFLSDTNNKKGFEIISCVVDMAKRLNIPTVAEGVESSDQSEFLSSIGCDFAQGFFFAKPMPIDSYENLMYCPA